jgi:hypothetical protein
VQQTVHFEVMSPFGRSSWVLVAADEVAEPIHSRRAANAIVMKVRPQVLVRVIDIAEPHRAGGRG